MYPIGLWYPICKKLLKVNSYGGDNLVIKMTQTVISSKTKTNILKKRCPALFVMGKVQMKTLRHHHTSTIHPLERPRSPVLTRLDSARLSDYRSPHSLPRETKDGVLSMEDTLVISSKSGIITYDTQLFNNAYIYLLNEVNKYVHTKTSSCLLIAAWFIHSWWKLQASRLSFRS